MTLASCLMLAAPYPEPLTNIPKGLRSSWVSVGVRGSRICNECWVLDRVWACGNKVSEARVAPG